MVEEYRFNLWARHASTICASEPQLEVQDKLAVPITGIVGDDQYLRVQKLDGELAKSNKSAFASWHIQRTFSQNEIDRAQLFLIVLRNKHAAGEEFGTWYTDGILDARCGVGRKQIKILQTNPFRSTHEDTKNLRCSLSSQRVGPLQIPYRELMKSHDIFSLWGGEVVTSGRLADLIEAGGFSGGKLLGISNTQKGSRSLLDLSDVPSGVELLRLAALKGLKVSDREYWQWLEEPAQIPLFEAALWQRHALHKKQQAGKSPLGDYKELTVQSSSLTTSDRSMFGNDPFRKTTEHCKCSFGEVRGNLLSQLSVIASSWDGSDICKTDLFFGGTQGLFRPYRQLVISRRLFKAMREAGMKGFDYEVVEMVS